MEIIQIVLIAAVLALLLKKKDPTPKKSGSKLILDTCALIDGRIIDLARSGFIQGSLIIPQFILKELQMLADGSDSHKRERARYGLDIAKELQDLGEVEIDRTEFPNIRPTDDKLVALAKKIPADLYTTDFNLNKVASIEGVRVLNVQELAQNLRPAALPGEKHSVKIVQKGSGRDQGVGYLTDGTMIVVDGGAKLINKTVDIEIVRIHQTVAGKMFFASLARR